MESRMSFFRFFCPFFVLASAVFVLISVSPSFSAFAEEAEPKDYLKEAVHLAAQVDAYNVFCQGEDGLGVGTIERYGKKEAKDRQEKLENLRVRSFEAMRKRLAEKKMECGGGDYLMEKLVLMQQLKINLAGILGVDPNKQRLDGSPLPPPPAELGDVMKPGAGATVSGGGKE